MRLDQAVLAAFYNDARLNILSCLNDIREKQGLSFIGDDAQIVSAFNDLSHILTQGTPEEASALIDRLRYRFPFIDTRTDASSRHKDFTPVPDNFQHIFQRVFQLINSLRNTLVHPVNSPLLLDMDQHKELFFMLNDIYDDARRLLKTRFDWNTRDIEPLLRHDRKGKPKAVNKFSFALCSEPKSRSNSPVIGYNRVLYDFGHVLLCSLFLDKSQSADLIHHFWQSGHGKFWQSQKHREMIKELISAYHIRLPLQRLKADSLTTLTIDALSELSRCPQPLLKTLKKEDKDKFREAQGTLDNIAVSDDAGNGAGNAAANSANKQNQTEQQASYLLARSHEDRFVPLMMRFLEHDPANKLRFAIDLGQFYYHVRLKSGDFFTDNKPRVRRLGQKLICYGHLNNLNKSDFWQQLEDNFALSSQEAKQAETLASAEPLQLKPYLVKTIPHYHFDNNKIGIRLAQSTGKSTDKQANKSANQKTDYPKYPEDKGISVEDIRQPIQLDKIPAEQMQAEFWISPAQMLHIGFYHYLYQHQQNATSGKATQSKSIEVLLNTYKAGTLRLFKALKKQMPELAGEAFSAERHQAVQDYINGFYAAKGGNSDNSSDYHISMANLPKVLVNALLGAQQQQEIPKQQIIDRANKLLQSTEQRQRQLERQLNAFKKRGHKDFRPIKCGNIGDFLTDDIIRFQAVDPSQNDGGKLNSQQYQILQKTLAYYGKYIDEPPQIIDLFQDFGLIEGDFKHPFLDKLGLQKNPHKYKGLLDFYKDYLKYRQAYIKEYLNRVSSHGNNDRQHNQQQPPLQAAHWLRLKKLSTLDGFFKETLTDNETLAQPLPLAKDFFYKPILNLLAEALNISPETLEQEGMQTFTRNNKTVKIRPAISWMIKYYHQHKNLDGNEDGDGDDSSDDVQTMYTFERSHKVFNYFLDKRGKKNKFKEKVSYYLSEQDRKRYLPEIREKISSLRAMVNQQKTNKKPLKDNISDEEKLSNKLQSELKSYKHQEKIIRHTAIQDILLSLYVRQYLDRLMQNQNPVNWKLKDIENTLLNQPIYHEFSVPGSSKKLFHPACKIRKLGELRLLARDRRLPSLLDYYPEEESLINQAEIRAELYNYRQARVDVMKLAHSLEQQIVKKYGMPKDKKAPKEQQKFFGKGRHGAFLHLLHESMGVQVNDTNGDKTRIKQALAIRNAFSHSEYPDSNILPQIKNAIALEAIPDNPAQNRKIALKLVDEMDRLYQPWLNFLKE